MLERGADPGSSGDGGTLPENALREGASVTKGESRALRRTAMRASRSAGRELLSVFRTELDVELKSDPHDVVTAQDRLAEERIVASIRADVPGSAFVGEEGGRRGDGRVEWYVDPIDGTANFARGIEYWCISVAAAVDDHVVAAAIFNPNTGDMFSADQGGAWRGADPLRSRGYPDEPSATLLSCFPEARHYERMGDDAARAHRQLLDQFRSVRNLGSVALDLAHVAAGWADATVGFDTHSWDIAAGAFIVEQAGGAFYPLHAGHVAPVRHQAADYYATVGEAEYPHLHELALHCSSRSSAL